MAGTMAPFDGVLVQVAEKDVRTLCKRFYAAKMRGQIPTDARLVVYDGGYVALEMDTASARQVLHGDGFRWMKRAG